MEKWQPIETAPTNGTIIWLFIKGRDWDDYCSGYWRDKGSYGQWEVNGYGADVAIASDPDASHFGVKFWMPIPEVPTI